MADMDEVYSSREEDDPDRTGDEEAGPSRIEHRRPPSSSSDSSHPPSLLLPSGIEENSVVPAREDVSYGRDKWRVRITTQDGNQDIYLDENANTRTEKGKSREEPELKISSHGRSGGPAMDDDGTDDRPNVSHRSNYARSSEKQEEQRYLLTHQNDPRHPPAASSSRHTIRKRGVHFPDESAYEEREGPYISNDYDAHPSRPYGVTVPYDPYYWNGQPAPTGYNPFTPPHSSFTQPIQTPYAPANYEPFGYSGQPTWQQAPAPSYQPAWNLPSGWAPRSHHLHTVNNVLPSAASTITSRHEKEVQELRRKIEEYEIKEDKEAALRRTKLEEERLKEQADVASRKALESERLAAERRVMEERILKAEKEAWIRVEERLKAEEEAKKREVERIERLKMEIRESIEMEIKVNQERTRREEEDRIRTKEALRAQLLAEKREHDEILSRQELRQREVERRVEREYEDKRNREVELLRYKEMIETKLKMEADKIIEQERRKYGLHTLGLDIRRNTEKVIAETLNKSSMEGHENKRYNALEFQNGTPSAIETELFRQLPHDWAMEQRHNHDFLHENTRHHPTNQPLGLVKEWHNPATGNTATRPVIGEQRGASHLQAQISAAQVPRITQVTDTNPFLPQPNHSQHLAQSWGEHLEQRPPSLQMPVPVLQRAHTNALQELIREGSRSAGLSSHIRETPGPLEGRTEVDTDQSNYLDASQDPVSTDYNQQSPLSFKARVEDAVGSQADSPLSLNQMQLALPSGGSQSKNLNTTRKDALHGLDHLAMAENDIRIENDRRYYDQHSVSTTPVTAAGLIQAAETSESTLRQQQPQTVEHPSNSVAFSVADEPLSVTESVAPPLRQSSRKNWHKKAPVSLGQPFIMPPSPPIRYSDWHHPHDAQQTIRQHRITEGDSFLPSIYAYAALTDTTARYRLNKTNSERGPSTESLTLPLLRRQKRFSKESFCDED
ncbi:hypothetical protein JX266_002056 [Neoarthrinium moseri]|nr:hypothetical protein JX266_002056 [Neoarthrinium moseri]